MHTRLLLIALALACVAAPALAIAGPGGSGGTGTAAATVDTVNDSVISLQPAEGPNGQYAELTAADELRLVFDDLNEDAVTTAHDVFVINTTVDEPVAVSVQTDAPGVSAYWGSDPAANASEAQVLGPGENATVGFRLNSSAALDNGNITVVATEPQQGAGGGFALPEEDEEDGSAELAVTDASVAPAELAVGETATVTATVENDGTAEGTKRVALSVDGVVVAVREVTVAAGGSKTVTFERTFQQAGTYAIAVDDTAAGSVSVREPDDKAGATGGFDVSNASLSPDAIEPGGTAVITADVTNRGDQAALFVAELAVGGVVVEEQAVEVAPGETREVRFERTFDRRGGYEVAVSGADAGTLRVESSTASSVRRYGSEFGWLLGAASLPTAGLGLVMIRRRREQNQRED